jgi:hypothetical protein
MAQAKRRQNLIFPDSFFPSSFFLSLFFPVFYITESDFGQTFHAETFSTLDDACDALNAMEHAQDCAYSYARELAISELKGQIQDFLEESTD